MPTIFSILYEKTTKLLLIGKARITVGLPLNGTIKKAICQHLNAGLHLVDIGTSSTPHPNTTTICAAPMDPADLWPEAPVAPHQ
jgi:hypothetical protein